MRLSIKTEWLNLLTRCLKRFLIIKELSKLPRFEKSSISIPSASPGCDQTKMLTSSPPKRSATPVFTAGQTDDNANDLKFISELGRSLLFTVHPKKVAARVAGAVQNVVGARICVFVAELENIGLITCAFG